MYFVLRNVRRPTSPGNLPYLLGTLDRDGNADSNRSGGKKFLGQIVPGHFGGKAALVGPLWEISVRRDLLSQVGGMIHYPWAKM